MQLVHHLRREAQAARERAEAVIALCDRAGVSVLVGEWDETAGLGTGRARTGGKRALPTDAAWQPQAI